MVDVTVTVRDATGNTTTRTVAVVQRPRFGVNCSAGEFAQTLVDFPGIRYHRDFGADGPDSDTLTEPPSHSSTKQTLAPASCVMHVSWKDDPNLLDAWLSAAPPERRYWLTWHHEPMGDVAPATYRASAVRFSEILATHPRRQQVLGHGPIVTRYWLDNAGGNPADWWYPGATLYGGDCYTGGAAYLTPEEMFGGTAQAARDRGVPWMVPEWGGERIPSDPTGAGRAAWIRDCADYLREQPDCLAAGWWNFTAWKISTDPERAVYRQILT